ncbi:MAG: hypothetical protein R6W91_07215 [Thermoplasmata archaeon]
MGQSSKKRRAIERLTKAYEEGKISKELYLENVKRLGDIEENDDSLDGPLAAESPSSPPAPEGRIAKDADEPQTKGKEGAIPTPASAAGSGKAGKVEEYIDKLISLGIKHPSRREALIIHYMGFDEKHMRKEIEFNGIPTDLMDCFADGVAVSQDTVGGGPVSQETLREIERISEPVQTQPVGELIRQDEAGEPEPNFVLFAPCKSCGHETHGKTSCGRCGADQVHRVSQKKLMAVSCVLLLIGAVYLGAASAFSETKISVIGDLQETDNFRQIRIVGKVIDLVDFYPEKYSESGTIRCLVNDGTGNMYVKIMPDITERFIRDGYIPGFGDTVDCEGSLFVGDDGYMQIKIRDKSLFRIRERAYTEITIPDLVPPVRSAFEIGQQVTVSGQIQGSFYIEGFAWILDLVDEEGRSVSIFIPDVIGLMTGELDLSNIYLAHVTVKGALEWYENAQSWEIIPAKTSDIEFVSAYHGDTYTTTTVSQLLTNGDAYNGKYVDIQDATVTWIYGAGDWLISISDASTGDDISVIMDNGANTSAPFSIGNTINVRGLVIPYEGEWEIKIRAMSSDYSLRVSEMGG